MTTILANKQADLNKLLEEASSFDNGTTLFIENYVDQKLEIAQYGNLTSLFQITIQKSEVLESIVLGTNNTPLIGLGIHDIDRVYTGVGAGLVLEDLPKLNALDLTGVALVSNLTFRDLPSLKRVNLQFGTRQLSDSLVQGFGINGQGLGMNGSLVIENTGIETFDFGSLEFLTIEGFPAAESIILANNNLTTISIPQLPTIFGSLNISGTQNSSIDISLDTLSAAGNIFLQGVSSVSLPQLVNISGSLEVTDSIQLEQINLDTLSFINESFSLKNLPQVFKVSATNLNSVGGDINILGSGEDIDLQSLEEVNGSLSVTAPLSL